MARKRERIKVIKTMRTRLYSISEAAELWGESEQTLYDEIAAGRLRAKLPRGRERGYRVTEEIMNDWVENRLVDVFDVKNSGVIA